ncbi:MAG: enoyl-CoA hydratase/isomerase family protein [Thermomicrobiales bacterium]|nr:enoyl-CoA hydratase/isomerase family protein [Thermomicrobiales bacterium]
MDDALTIVRDGPVTRITLNRPERRNALSRALVRALHAAFSGLDPETRVVLLAGAGPSFCAGGDIAEFAAAAEDGQAEGDAESLADCLSAIATCPVPVVARIQGNAFGGGVGLLCAADIAIAADDARFSLSEARLGLVPAVISPYVLAALGPREGKARMLLAAPFDAAEALRIGLIQRAVPASELDGATDVAIADLLKSPPGALATIKRLPDLISGDAALTRHVTTALLTERLASDEAGEGLRAFLEKRPANWIPAS